MIDEKTVRGWLREITDRIEMSQAAVSRLRGEIARDTQKQQALEALLASDSPAERVGAGSPTRKSPPETTTRQAAEHPIESGAVAVLEESGKPLHISELRRALEQKGIPIPGKGTDANVIVYLSRAADVCRVGKGLYALRGWGVPAVPPRRRRSKNRRSKRRERDS